MNIKLEIKYYVPFDRLMGKTEVFYMEGGLKLIDFLELLAKKYKGFAIPNLFDQMVILVNGKICKKDAILNNGDLISILTPLVGG